ncbi:neocarzinostatin apoprotein domain-containing protein [Yinghuangia aomiensis]
MTDNPVRAPRRRGDLRLLVLRGGVPRRRPRAGRGSRARGRRRAHGVQVDRPGPRAGENVTVTGKGFAPGIQVFVAVCDPAQPAGKACDMANYKMATVDAGGGFVADVKLVAKFGQTDCTATPCAVQTSRMGNGKDRTQEALAAIGFTGGVAPTLPSKPQENAGAPGATAPAGAASAPAAAAPSAAAPAPADNAAASSDDDSDLEHRADHRRGGGCGRGRRRRRSVLLPPPQRELNRGSRPSQPVLPVLPVLPGPRRRP